MIRVDNDIKVPFRRYSRDVLISTTSEGEIILFNHNNISPCPAGMFTGIDFEIPSWIVPKYSSISEEPLDFLFWKKYIAVRLPDNKMYEEPIAYVKFVNRNSGFVFKGHLIEIGGK